MTSKSRGHCDNIKVFNQGKSNQIGEKSGNLIAKNVWPPCKKNKYSETCVREPPLRLTSVVDEERWLSYKGTSCNFASKIT